MTAEQKQAYIEAAHKWIEVMQRYIENHPQDISAPITLGLYEIALAALTAQPDSAPCDWVYIRFTDISKSQRMKCQIAWSDWLNSVIYDEEGAPLLISNSAFQVIRAAGYQVEGE